MQTDARAHDIELPRAGDDSVSCVKFSPNRCALPGPPSGLPRSVHCHLHPVTHYFCLVGEEWMSVLVCDKPPDVRPSPLCPPSSCAQQLPGLHIVGQLVLRLQLSGPS